ncbi:MAG TPA: sigma-70 family RNA polymerase sigma factor [Jatrophihabitantaceae bacterium]|nr:sigma-70 family RNA polymerase sigma factor [Jatrophihabitantaceae bacterium]
MLRELVLAVLMQPAFAVAGSQHEMASDTVAGHSGQTTQSPRRSVEDTHAESWELVSRAQAGDGEAFGQLFLRYKDMVYRYLYYRVGDQATAEDFTSETFLRALRRIGTITYQGRDIGAWFVTIARNIVFDHAKSARHRLEVTIPETIEHTDPGPCLEDSVISALTTERLMRALNTLGTDQRECLMLRFIQGMSVTETAEIMGRNSGAIKALQHRAIRKLADLVRGELR